MAATSGPGELRPSARIGIADVRMGMFISSLDRPWTGTPFELEAFLLTEQSQLDTLQGLVKEVTIDLRRSLPDSYLHLPRSVVYQQAAGARDKKDAQRVHVMYADAPESQQGAGAGLTAFLRGLMGSRSQAQPEETAQAANAGESNASPRAFSSLPYYLRYGSRKELAEVPGSLALEKRLKQSESQAVSLAENFARLISVLYPRDVVFMPLNWLERWQSWWLDYRSRRNWNSRHIGKAARPAQADVPPYWPADMKLVIYRDRPARLHDYSQARAALAKTDRLMEHVAADVKAGSGIAMDEVKACVADLAACIIENPTALLWSLGLQERSRQPHAQAEKTAVYMMAFGRHLGFDRDALSELGIIGLLMDLGLLRLPPDTAGRIRLEREELTLEQRRDVAGHVRLGVQMLGDVALMSPAVADGIAQHHERLDGSGYPHGLVGEAIGIHGKIAAIVDTFVDLTTATSYQAPLSAFDALKQLFQQAGTRLHAPLVEQFVQAISVFPVGSLIELSSGEVAVVLEHNWIRRLEPKVLVLSMADKKALTSPFMIDLMKYNSAATGESLKIVRALPDGAYNLGYNDHFFRKS